jgi:hypothetical protein
MAISEHYRKLNEKHKYQLLDGDVVAAEEWTVHVNGGPDQGGKTVWLCVPLPDCPSEAYDGYMRKVREAAMQNVRIALKAQGMTGPIRLRVAGIKRTFSPASVVFGQMEVLASTTTPHAQEVVS